MYTRQRFQQLHRKSSCHQQDIRGARRLHEAQAVNKPEILHCFARARPGDGENVGWGVGRKPTEDAAQAHSNARSLQV